MIKSSFAFLIYAGLMVAMGVGASFKSTIPYETFAINFTLGFGAYVTKRLIQKRPGFKSPAVDAGVNNGSQEVPPHE